MRILAALRARTMAGAASTPSVATPWRSSWRRRAAAVDGASSKGMGFPVGGGEVLRFRRACTPPDKRASRRVRGGLEGVALTDEAGGPTAIGQFHLAQTQRRRDQRQKAAHLRLRHVPQLQRD